MISTLCLIKPIALFCTGDHPKIDLPVGINGTRHKYEYYFCGSWHELKDLEKVRVKNDWRIVRCWK